MLALALEFATISDSADRGELIKRLNDFALRSMNLAKRFPSFVELGNLEIQAHAQLARLALEEGRAGEAKTEWSKVRFPSQKR